MSNDSSPEMNPYAAPIADSSLPIGNPGQPPKVTGCGNVVFLTLGAFLGFIGIAAITITSDRIGLLSGLPPLIFGILLIRHGLIRHKAKSGYVGFALLWGSIFLIAFFFFLIVSGR
ncbi:MAG: hypothetical protein AAF497_06270 [Planctomycetota bacterium]